MAFRDLLVLVGDGSEAAGGYALWLSGACAASLTATAPTIEPSLPAYAAAEMPSSILSQISEDAQAAADRTLQDFTKKARTAGVAVETLSFKATAGRVGDAVGRLARRFDAIILQQPDPKGPDTSDILEGALFQSGHPLIVVPYIRAQPQIRTALVAWDGSASAARAVSDALPVLALARHVEVVTVGDKLGRDTHLSGAALARHLVHHGIAAEPKRLLGEDIDVANMLLSHAADAGADFLVMGGYGHSRLREIVLGGVTREILRSMTVPVLMSH